MEFSQFLILLFASYACYYLILIFADQLNHRIINVDDREATEFVISPNPVKVQMQEGALLHLEEHFRAEEDLQDRDETVTPVEEFDNLAYNLGLETVSAPSGIHVASPQFLKFFRPFL